MRKIIQISKTPVEGSFQTVDKLDFYRVCLQSFC